MFHLVQQSVARHLREHGRNDVGTDHVICLDVTNRRIDGYCYLFGSARTFPQLVAKAARTTEGRTVLEIEFENLQTLQRMGLNENRVSTPEPLGLEVEGDLLITLQSALPGTLMKNLPGRDLFSTSRVEQIFALVVDWWTRFVRGFGISRVELSEERYEQEVLTEVTRFRNRYLLERDEHELLTRRFEHEHPLLSLELPLMARHGDFCTANIALQDDAVSVLDWEFPLAPRMPLFDLLYFFSSSRYPFGGLRGESSHFDSFVEVYWGEGYFSELVRRSLREVCAGFDLPEEILPDLLLLSLVQVANMKYEALVTSHEFEYADLPDEAATEAEKRRRWGSFRDADRDEPLALVQGGRLPVLGQFVRRGFPRVLIRILETMKLSVIIPTHNRPEVLLRTLRALAEQTLERARFEVVVVDDGSTEQNRESIRDFKAPYNYWLVEKTQGGLASARNYGAEQAEGDHLHFLDDDVLPHPDLLEQHLLSHEATREETAVVGALPYPPDVKMNTFLWYLERSGHYDLYKHPDKYPGGKPPMPPLNGNSSLSREAFLRIGKYDETFRRYGSEDLDLGYRLDQAGVRFVYNPKAIGYHDHIKSFGQFCTDMETAGESLIQLYRKFPEIKVPKKIDVLEDPLGTLPGKKKLVKIIMTMTLRAPWLLALPRAVVRALGPV